MLKCTCSIRLDIKLSTDFEALKLTSTNIQSVISAGSVQTFDVRTVKFGNVGITLQIRRFDSLLVDHLANHTTYEMTVLNTKILVHLSLQFF